MSNVNFFHELTEMFQIDNHYIGMLTMSTQNSSEIDNLRTKITRYKEDLSKTTCPNSGSSTINSSMFSFSIDASSSHEPFRSLDLAID
jgi:hypothetical protein